MFLCSAHNFGPYITRFWSCVH